MLSQEPNGQRHNGTQQGPSVGRLPHSYPSHSNTPTPHHTLTPHHTTPHVVHVCCHDAAGPLPPAFLTQVPVVLRQCASGGRLGLSGTRLACPRDNQPHQLGLDDWAVAMLALAFGEDATCIDAAGESGAREAVPGVTVLASRGCGAVCRWMWYCEWYCHGHSPRQKAHMLLPPPHQHSALCQDHQTLSTPSTAPACAMMTDLTLAAAAPPPATRSGYRQLLIAMLRDEVRQAPIRTGPAPADADALLPDMDTKDDRQWWQYVLQRNVSAEGTWALYHT